MAVKYASINKLVKTISQLPVIALAALALWGTTPTHAADPVITDPLATTIGVFTGGDKGEGLDLDGTFIYAISTGADPDLNIKIRDATFMGQQTGDEVPGATLEAGNRIKNWYNVDYGDTQADDDLEAATSSIRWSQAGAAIPAITLTLENLEPGVQYKFQMTFGEECCNRGFDIFFDDVLILKDFNPGVVHEGISEGTKEALVTHLYTPKTKTIVLKFDGTEASSDYSDHNAILNAVTVEKLGVAVDTDKDGMPDSYETQNGFNPNDASDAAKDFDSDGVSNLDEFKAGTDPKDVTKPTVVSATATGSFNTVIINFSEEVDPATATALANYTFTPSLTVSAATYKKKAVTLTTSAQTSGATKYTVAVKGVKDGSKNEVPAGSSAVFYSYLLTKNGVLKFSYWGGIGGNAVQGLLDDPRYPATPDEIHPVYQINSRDAFPTDSHEKYGATMEGFVTPAESGSYRFFLRSDDNGLLQVSTDDKEANLEQVAEQTACCNGFTEPDSPFTSEPRALVAGRKYFIRVFYKEGGGGDWCEVAWRKEGDTTPAGSLRPIPSKFLSAAVDLPAPPEGAWVTQSPGPNAKGVSPVATVRLAHRDGNTPWTAQNVTMKFDGVAVTPTFTKDGSVLTVDYDPNTLLGSKSVHTISLSYPDAGGNSATTEYSFTVLTYNGSTADKVAGYPALLQGSSVYTADAGGATGKAGDKAIDLTLKGGPVATYDKKFLAAANDATSKDELSVSFWQKNLNTADSSAFTLNSPSAGNSRGFHAHVPWSNQNVYFDTVGCCDGTTQRITADINTFEDYTTGDPRDNLWWTTKWHHWVFTKKGSQKNIYIDGKLFLNGDSTNPLRTDHNAFYMGSGSNGGEMAKAIIDDYAVFGKELTLADAAALKGGTLPSALPAAKGLIAYWDFNATAPPAAPALGAARGAAGKVTLTFEGTLQSSATAGGTYTDVAGASPLTVDATDSRFYRAVRK